VTLTSNESTVTPAGGVSVIVKDIGTSPITGGVTILDPLQL